MKNQNTNLTAALDLLKGKTVVAHDRRAAEATAIDFTKRTVQGEVLVRPSYGVSYHMQNALEALAKRTEIVRGMPVYIF